MTKKWNPGALAGATGAVSRLSGPDAATVADHQPSRQFDAIERAEPVRGLGVMTLEGLRYENTAWRRALLDQDGRGRDPFTIPLDVLAVVGHPKRSLAQLRRAMATTTRGRPDPDAYPAHIRTYKAIRAHCYGCAETPVEARRCAIFNCPFWPYRLGRNPWSAARGRLPVGKARQAGEAGA